MYALDTLLHAITGVYVLPKAFRYPGCVSPGDADRGGWLLKYPDGLGVALNREMLLFNRAGGAYGEHRLRKIIIRILADANGDLDACWKKLDEDGLNEFAVGTGSFRPAAASNLLEALLRWGDEDAAASGGAPEPYPFPRLLVSARPYFETIVSHGPRILAKSVRLAIRHLITGRTDGMAMSNSLMAYNAGLRGADAEADGQGGGQAKLVLGFFLKRGLLPSLTQLANAERHDERVAYLRAGRSLAVAASSLVDFALGEGIGVLGELGIGALDPREHPTIVELRSRTKQDWDAHHAQLTKDMLAMLRGSVLVSFASVGAGPSLAAGLCFCFQTLLPSNSSAAPFHHTLHHSSIECSGNRWFI